MREREPTKYDCYEKIIRNNDLDAFEMEWYGGFGVYWETFKNAWDTVNKDRLNYQNCQVTYPITKEHKISICIVCMNRLDDLKQTLLHNIEANTYQSIEFVLLDYNSKEDVKEFIKTKEVNKYVQQEILKYYKTEEPEYYNHPHAHNCVVKLATGDIVVIVHSDVFLHNTYAETVNIMVNQFNGKKILIGTYPKLFGGIAVRKEFFLDFGGFDEELEGWGPITYDLQLRMMMSGFTHVVISKKLRTRFVGKYLKNINYPIHLRRFKTSDDQMKFQIYSKIMKKQYKRNVGKKWGKCLITTQ